MLHTAISVRKGPKEHTVCNMGGNGIQFSASVVRYLSILGFRVLV